MRSLVSFFAVLILSAACYCQDFQVPKQTIVGISEAVPLGELVILSPSPLPEVKNLTKVVYQWTILEDGKEKTRIRKDGDGTVSFGAGVKPKTVQVILSCSYLFIPSKDGDKPIGEPVLKANMLFGSLTIGDKPDVNPDVNPDNPPKPNPTPSPTPPPVDGSEKFGAALDAYNLGTKVSDKTMRLNGAKALSTSYSAIASRIAAGTLKGDKNILTEVTSSNRQALTDAKVTTSSWEEFNTTIQDKIFGLYESNKLKSDEDYAQFYRELARGLSYVK